MEKKVNKKSASKQNVLKDVLDELKKLNEKIEKLESRPILIYSQPYVYYPYQPYINPQPFVNPPWIPWITTTSPNITTTGDASTTISIPPPNTNISDGTVCVYDVNNKLEDMQEFVGCPGAGGGNFNSNGNISFEVKS